MSGGVAVNPTTIGWVVAGCLAAGLGLYLLQGPRPSADELTSALLPEDVSADVETPAPLPSPESAPPLSLETPAARLAALYDQPAPLPDGAAEGLVALFEEIGVAAEGERRVRAHFGAALAALREARPRAEAGTLLECLAESLLGRKA